ncbi:hypothetical protein KI387_043150, partial [Taxus chinensis]
GGRRLEGVKGVGGGEGFKQRRGMVGGGDEEWVLREISEVYGRSNWYGGSGGVLREKREGFGGRRGRGVEGGRGMGVDGKDLG